jgi:hypothetical protein
LAAAGRLYRIRLAPAPEDVYAQRGRDEVVRLATASQAALKPTPAAGTSRAQVVVGVVLFLLVMAMAFFIFRQFRMSMGAF